MSTRDCVIPVDSDVEIRSWELGDAEELFNLIDSNREMLQEWLIWVPGITSKADCETFIKKCQKEYEKKVGLQMGLWDKDELVGTIGLNNIDVVSKKASIGYWLSGDYQGKGAMTKAVKSLIDYGFDTLELNRIELRIASENKKSKSIAERLKFQEEGTLRQDEYLNGQYVDYVVCSLLVTERS